MTTTSPVNLVRFRLLLAKSQADLAAASLLAGDSHQSDEVVGFHVQQAVEKALKAVLAASGQPVPRTHDIAHLLELLDDVAAPAELDGVELLTRWAVLGRYEAVAHELDRSEALAKAECAVAWA